MQVLIDINQSDLELESKHLEAYSLRLVDELGEISDGASLVRADQIPRGALSVDGRFDLGFLQAEIKFANFKKVLDWLLNIFSAHLLELEYEEAGRTVKLKYKTNQELDAQVAALERIADIQKIKVKVIAKGQLS
ncbi:hypothetical protein [Acaryochloris marina]|uniref:hypothetical protein n=1 Tax=Acaryochloris marina TaxID=155978 RepID=UPI001BAE60E5|nr:hypothetical protein [Acaryochloris marina]QUY40411.1 hypothetical protein I1H34_00750 [Acaryochloris marina S15]